MQLETHTKLSKSCHSFSSLAHTVLATALTCAVLLQTPQDAQKFWQRNKAEEGGGGYLAWNWDSSIWGADVLLAAQTSNTQYGAEVRPRPLLQSNSLS